MNMFCEAYPRGGNNFKKLYTILNNYDIITWFKNQGVELKTEKDGRVFPVSDNSQTIIDCFIKLCKKLDIEIKIQTTVNKITSKANQVLLHTNNEELMFDKVVICMGGANNRNHYQMLHKLGHNILEPLPSLFTFNLVDKKICQLMGISVKNVLVKIQKTKLENVGDILITHWGFSGPVIIKLSAFSAQILHEANYEYDVKINWINIPNENELRGLIEAIKKNQPQKIVFKNPQFLLPSRLWEYLCTESGISETVKWVDLPAKLTNKLVEALTNSTFKAKGKTTFKEEFVTCGGVDLNDINLETMESKSTPNLYFAGEVINIDGITGGFNFQNAWTTAYVVAKNI
jgi:predicted Rossmann fold flavoprotein